MAPLVNGYVSWGNHFSIKTYEGVFPSYSAITCPGAWPEKGVGVLHPPHHSACRQICSTTMVVVEVLLLMQIKESLFCEQIVYEGSLC